MTVRIGLVGARAEVALMVAGVAAGCGAEVVTLDDVGGVLEGVAAGGGADPGPPGGTGRWPGPGAPGAVVDPAVACDLVLVDAVGLQRRDRLSAGLPCAAGPGRGGPWLVVHVAGESHASREWAGAMGMDHVVELPAGQRWLAGLLAAP